MSEPTMFIDNFRAFSTAAHLFDRGVNHIVLAETRDEVRTTKSEITRARLCGEGDGSRPDGFELGDSRVEVGAHRDVYERTVVMRTSAGTRGVVAALWSGADPIPDASPVVAGVTALAVRRYGPMTIIA